MDFEHSTIMSVLIGVAQEGQALRRERLERFAAQYTQPLVTFLVRTKGLLLDEAEEVVQDFWLAKLILPPSDQTIAAKYLASAQKRTTTSGSFRRYLMRAVGFHFIDTLRRRKNTSISLEALDGFDVISPQDCLQFDAAWANSIFRACINEVRAECMANDQGEMWELFCLQIVLPRLRSTTPPGYAELAAQFHFDDARAAANAVRTVIRKFQKRLKTHVNDYLPVSSTEDRAERVEQEYTEVVALLSQSGTLDLALFDDILSEFSSHSSLVNVQSSMLSANIEETRLFADPEQSLYASDEDLRYRWLQILQTSVPKWLSDNGETCAEIPALSFQQLVAGQAVSIDCLLLLRNVAKRLAREEQDEPPVLLACIYQVAIICGINTHSRLLTNDSLEKVAQRVDQLLRADWLDAETRNLLTKFRQNVA